MLSSLKRKFGKNRQGTGADKMPSETERSSTSNPTFMVTEPSDEASEKTVGSEDRASNGAQMLVTLKNGSSVTSVQACQQLEVPSVEHHQSLNRRSQLRPNSASSLQSATNDERVPDGPGRKRTSSDTSASSFHTCVGDSKSSLLQKRSPTLGRPGTPSTPTLPESLSEVVEFMMQNFEERMTSLEHKIDNVNHTLESRIAEMEKRQCIESHSPSAMENRQSGEVKELSVLKEVIFIYCVPCK